jgi:hypothetical protein
VPNCKTASGVCPVKSKGCQFKLNTQKEMKVVLAVLVLALFASADPRAVTSLTDIAKNLQRMLLLSSFI